MADIEKARELLRGILRDNYKAAFNLTVDRVVGEALRTLDGDGAGEWTVRGSGRSPHHLGADWDVLDGQGRMVATCRHEATARRIARLPAMERAAHPFVSLASYHERDADESTVPVSLRSIRAMAAALNPEGQS